MYCCVELVVMVKFLLGYWLVEMVAAVRLPCTMTLRIEDWSDLTMRRFPASRLTFSWGFMVAAVGPAMTAVARQVAIRIRILVLAFNQTTVAGLTTPF